MAKINTKAFYANRQGIEDDTILDKIFEETKLPERSKALVPARLKRLLTTIKIKPFHNEVQTYIAKLLRLAYQQKLYPLDVKNPKDAHTYHQYGTQRGISIGRYYLHQYIQQTLKLVGSPKNCLEIGDGHFLKSFYKCETNTALDIKDKRADIIADIETVSITSEYDAIICFQVLEHVDHPINAMKNMHKMLQSGGLLVLSYPFIGPIHGAPHDTNRITMDGVKILARDSGFTIVDIVVKGNSLTSIGYMLEMASEDFSKEELDTKDNFQYMATYAILKKT
jgi:hypothetical protein